MNSNGGQRWRAHWGQISRPLLESPYAAENLAQLFVKGTEVYVEGRLKMNTWQGADGALRSGLNITAWKIELLGQIGRRRPAPDSSRERRQWQLVGRGMSGLVAECRWRCAAGASLVNCSAVGMTQAIVLRRQAPEEITSE